MHWNTTQEPARLEEDKFKICANPMIMLDKQEMSKSLLNWWNRWSQPMRPTPWRSMPRKQSWSPATLMASTTTWESETVSSFKYLGSVVSDTGTRTEILSRSAQTAAAMTQLRPISSSSSRTSDGQSSLAGECCSPLQIREAAVELLGLRGWLGSGPHSQFLIQLTGLFEMTETSRSA